MTLPPEGHYPAIATPNFDGQLVTFGAAGTKTEEVLVQFRLLEGIYAGTVLGWFGFLTRDAWRLTIRQLRVAGWKGRNLSDVRSLDHVVSVVVKHSLCGRYAHVDWVRELTGPRVRCRNTMTEDRIQRLCDELAAQDDLPGESDGITLEEFKAREGEPEAPRAVVNFPCVGSAAVSG